MSTLFWPGDHRADAFFSDAALVDAMVEVEAAWLSALAQLGLVPPDAADPLAGLVGVPDLPALAVGSEGGGNPVIPFLSMLRERLRDRNETAAACVHRGLTSQDVLDTALVLMIRDVRDRLDESLRDQVVALSRLAREHRDTPMVGRTLTRPAVPITFGAKIATWLHGLLDARDALGRLTLRAQFGGAAGTRSGAAAVTAGSDVTPERLSADAAERLGLATRLAVADRTRHDDVGRGRADRRDQRMGPHRQRCPHAVAARDRRTVRAARRGSGRVVDDAAEGESRAVAADPPRRAHRARRSHRCSTSPPQTPATNAPTERGTSSGNRCNCWPATRSPPPGRRASCSTDCPWTSTRWRATSTPRAPASMPSVTCSPVSGMSSRATMRSSTRRSHEPAPQWRGGHDAGHHSGAARRRRLPGGPSSSSGRRSGPARRRCGAGAPPSCPTGSTSSAGTCPGTVPGRRSPSRSPSPTSLRASSRGGCAVRVGCRHRATRATRSVLPSAWCYCSTIRTASAVPRSPAPARVSAPPRAGTNARRRCAVRASRRCSSRRGGAGSRRASPSVGPRPSPPCSVRWPRSTPRATRWRARHWPTSTSGTGSPRCARRSR